MGNQTLRTPPNQDTLKDYLNRINTILSEQQTGVWLVSLQSVTANAEGQPENARLTQLVLEKFRTNRQPTAGYQTALSLSVIQPVSTVSSPVGLTGICEGANQPTPRNKSSHVSASGANC